MAKKWTEQEHREFAAAWADLAAYPSVADVAARFGINAASCRMRAHKCRKLGIACASREKASNWLRQAAAERRAK